MKQLDAIEYAARVVDRMFTPAQIEKHLTRESVRSLAEESYRLGSELSAARATLNANAGLIAAAPDLLAALRVACKAIIGCTKYSCEGNCPCCVARALATAAIAKAEGK